MKYRWSDGYRHAIEFEAATEANFSEAGLDALMTFRVKTDKRYHDGSDHKNKVWQEKAELHLWDGSRWSGLGIIREIDGMSYWTPCYPCIPGVTIVECGPIPDAAYIRDHAAEWLRMTGMTFRWINELSGMISDVIAALNTPLPRVKPPAPGQRRGTKK